jgi:hypothetical protein
MAYRSRTLSDGMTGDDVIELQMRLAGFRGTLPDGDFGGGTKLQVQSFQRDVMGIANPNGVADASVFDAIDAFAAQHPVNFAQLRCPCGVCNGFGRGKFKGLYSNARKVEMFYRYEYPGIHRMILWAYRATQFYARVEGWQLTINSGYRCSENNRINGRSSTNHHGKAIDIDILNAPSKVVDRDRCNRLRGILVSKANAQIGWLASNRKSLEPADIAPTWVHYDVRSYDRKYLDDRYFVTTAAALDTAP